MGDENPICTLRDYSKPSQEGYKNTIELPDPNQHLNDFLKLMDSLDLDGENRKRSHLFSQRDEEVVFRMPQRTKELDVVSSLEKDKFEVFFVESLKVIFDEKKLGSS
ncbi:hypothetical protein Tco_1440066 [Tanacetum coccineum]